jgi:hypothetical protein
MQRNRSSANSAIKDLVGLIILCLTSAHILERRHISVKFVPKVLHVKVTLWFIIEYTRAIVLINVTCVVKVTQYEGIWMPTFGRTLETGHINVNNVVRDLHSGAHLGSISAPILVSDPTNVTYAIKDLQFVGIFWLTLALALAHAILKKCLVFVPFLYMYIICKEISYSVESILRSNTDYQYM